MVVGLSLLEYITALLVGFKTWFRHIEECTTDSVTFCFLFSSSMFFLVISDRGVSKWRECIYWRMVSISYPHLRVFLSLSS